MDDLVSGQVEGQNKIENKTGQWLGATVGSAGVDGPIVVSRLLSCCRTFL